MGSHDDWLHRVYRVLYDYMWAASEDQSTPSSQLPGVEKRLQHPPLACLHCLFVFAFEDMVLVGSDNDGCEYIHVGADQLLPSLRLGRLRVRG